MKNKKLKETLKFGGASLLLLAFFILVLQSFEFTFLQEWLAGFVAGFFGMNASGNLLSFQEGTFQINNYCTGLYSISLLASLLIPLKTINWKKKAGFFLAGAATLFVINIFRVALIAWAGINYGLELAELVHWASWVGIGMLVFAVWLKGLK